MADPKQRDRSPDAFTEPQVDEAVMETFPASDPVGHAASSGARAVSAGEMLASGNAAPPADATTISARFKDAESAKLAVEEVVRNGPVDRRATEIQAGDDAVTVQVTASRKDAARLQEMLQKQGGA